MRVTAIRGSFRDQPLNLGLVSNRQAKSLVFTRLLNDVLGAPNALAIALRARAWQLVNRFEEVVLEVGAPPMGLTDDPP